MSAAIRDLGQHQDQDPRQKLAHLCITGRHSSIWTLGYLPISAATLAFGHHRQCQGQDPRQGSRRSLRQPSPSDTIDNVKAKIQDRDPTGFCSNPRLRTPLTTSRPRSKTQIATCLCGKPSPSDTIDNVKAKIQDRDPTGFCSNPRLRTPLTTSRPRSKTQIATRLCGKPSPSDTIDNVKAKIQDTDPTRLCSKPASPSSLDTVDDT